MWDGSEWLPIGSRQTPIGSGDFGDGSDGLALYNGTSEVLGAVRSGTTYTIKRDVYYTDMTVSTGVTVKPGGFRIYGTGTLRLEGTAIIERNGNNGTSGASGGAGGTAIAESGAYLRGSIAGGAGSLGATAGVAGGNRSNSIGSNGAAGAAGGAGTSGSAGAGGVGGTRTKALVAPIDKWNVKTLLDIGPGGATVKYENSAASGGGGGGGAGTGGAGGRGGGAGSGGGIIAIYFLEMVFDNTSSITANGGNGGAGQVASNTGAGGGGGGAGGNGGQIILVYNELDDGGATISVDGGTGGAGGAGNGGGSAGSAGTDGSDGNIRKFEYSL